MSKGSNQHAQLNVLERSQHNISRSQISESALKVLYRLDKAGYRACLVGGGVRDVLLGKQPKDFDVATDATPDEVRALFKNSRLIGRRFRLAHIRFGREVIEVATFRSLAADSSNTELNQDGRILRDNTFGSIEEAVEMANSTRFGFQFGAFTSGLANAYYLAENIKAGSVYINEATSCWDEMAPFGGVKRSGVGRMLSDWIFNELSEIKMIMFDLGKVKK